MKVKTEIGIMGVMKRNEFEDEELYSIGLKKTFEYSGSSWIRIRSRGTFSFVKSTPSPAIVH